MRKLSFLVVLLLAGLFYRLPRKSNPIKPLTLIPSTTKVNRIVLIPKLPVRLAGSERQRRRVHFNSIDEVTRLEQIIVDVSDTIDSEKRMVRFRESGIDTTGHLESALAILSQEYAQPFNEGEIRTRLLALHYLNLSSHLDIETCKSLLQGAVQGYEKGSNPLVSKAHLWDAHDIAQTCTRLDSRAMVEYTQSVLNPRMAAQLKLVLKTEGVL